MAGEILRVRRVPLNSDFCGGMGMGGASLLKAARGRKGPRSGGFFFSFGRVGRFFASAVAFPAFGVAFLFLVAPGVFYRRWFRFCSGGVSVSPRLVLGSAFFGPVGDAAAGKPASGEVAGGRAAAGGPAVFCELRGNRRGARCFQIFGGNSRGGSRRPSNAQRATHRQGRCIWS